MSMSVRVSLVCMLALPVASSAQQGVAGDAYQAGLYLQRTRGELDDALAAFQRAVDSTGAGAVAVQVLLQQAECLEWAGRSEQKRRTITALKARAETADALLGPAGIFPAESDLILHLDIERLRLAPLLRRLRIDFDQEVEGGEEFEKVVAELGIDPRRDIRRLTLGLSLSGDDERPVDHWVVHLEGELAGFREGVVADLARALAEEADDGGGSELSLDVDETTDDRLMLEIRREEGPGAAKSPALRKDIRVKVEHGTLHGRRVLMARAEGAPAGGGAVEVGLARLDEHTLLIGERRGLDRTLAAMAGESVGLRANPKLWRIAERLPADAGFWLMLSPDEILRRAEKIQGALGWGDELPEVTGLMISGRVDEDVTLSVKAWTSDAESARTLADLVRGGLALARIAAAAAAREEPALFRLIEGLQVRVADRLIELRAVIPAELLELHVADEQARVLSMVSGAELRMALSKVTAVAISDPKIVDARIDRGAVVIKAKRPGRTDLLVERPGRPKQRYSIRVTAARP